MTTDGQSSGKSRESWAAYASPQHCIIETMTQFLLIAVVICIFIHPYSAICWRIERSVLLVAIFLCWGCQKRSWLENLHSQLGEGYPVLTVGELEAKIEALDKDVSENFDKRFLDDNEEYENMQVARYGRVAKIPCFRPGSVSNAEKTSSMAWNRPPLPNFRRLDQSMDAVGTRQV